MLWLYTRRSVSAPSLGSGWCSDTISSLSQICAIRSNASLSSGRSIRLASSRHSLALSLYSAVLIITCLAEPNPPWPTRSRRSERRLRHNQEGSYTTSLPRHADLDTWIDQICRQFIALNQINCDSGRVQKVKGLRSHSIKMLLIAF